MKIEQGKEYMTCKGRRWTMYALHAGGDWPVHGAFQTEHGRWVVGAWDLEGKHISNHDFDLVKVPEKFVRERWVNVFDDGSESIHDNLWNADNHMKHETRHRIAVVPVKLEGVQGQNLEK